MGYVFQGQGHVGNLGLADSRPFCRSLLGQIKTSHGLSDFDDQLFRSDRPAPELETPMTLHLTACTHPPRDAS